MIEIKVDKESEFIWLMEIIETGLINMANQKYVLENLNIPLKQNITYKKSDTYVNDINFEKIHQNNILYGNSIFAYFNRILRDEYKNKEI